MLFSNKEVYPIHFKCFSGYKFFIFFIQFLIIILSTQIIVSSIAKSEPKQSKKIENKLIHKPTPEEIKKKEEDEVLNRIIKQENLLKYLEKINSSDSFIKAKKICETFILDYQTKYINISKDELNKLTKIVTPETITPYFDVKLIDSFNTEKKNLYDQCNNLINSIKTYKEFCNKGGESKDPKQTPFFKQANLYLEYLRDIQMQHKDKTNLPEQPIPSEEPSNK